MDNDSFERYGRQMIVPEIGLQGQLKLEASRVLIVGAGGLGSPAIAYLAGAGVGLLGIIDMDVVDASNLHRQIIHHVVGKPKAESAAEYVKQLNPKVSVKTWQEPLSADNAEELIAEFDVVLDCTDTPKTRYLVNDACVLRNKPLVSASALKTEGQLAVYHYRDGPCYRCLFPHPPPPHLVTACGEGGIIGPVVGIMGVYQAVEAMKVILQAEIPHSLALFSMFSFPQWRQMKIRGRQASCIVCGDDPQITSLGSYNYDEFCGSISYHQFRGRRISAAELKNLLDGKKPRTIVDVRPSTQYEMASLPNSLNIPIEKFRKLDASGLPWKSTDEVILVCRNGNDSQEAAQLLTDWGIADVKDVIGGLRSWSAIEPKFPRY